ncbi:hypothetical protein EZV61_14240 [Corallincola luteus]|uniref:Chromosome partition protein Smc n=1 Tax=Corallincola luteus TaxID=1775177 RepID=A0ABY2AII4_9GAMM|nr:hypothetical protein [Corallincola luteus]TCI02509.1 hypothetical protein EZV61_14240 [Corallincola luteus]
MSEQKNAEKDPQLISLLEVMSNALSQCKPATLNRINEQAGFQPGTVSDVIAKSHVLLSDDKTVTELPAELNILTAKLWQQALSLATVTKGSVSTSSAEIDAAVADIDDIAELRKQFQALSKHSASLETQLKSKVSSEQLLQKNLGKARIEIATLKSSQLNTKMLRESAEKEKLHADQYHKQFEAAKTEIYHLCKQLEQQKKSHQSEAKVDQDRIVQLEQELSQVSTDVDSKSGLQDAELATLKSEIEKANDQIASLEQSLETEKAQNSVLEKQLSSKHSTEEKSLIEKASLKEKTAHLEEQISSLSAALEAKETSLAEYKERIEAEATKSAQIEASLRSHESTIEQQRCSLEVTESELIELKQSNQSLAEANSSLDALKKELVTLKNCQQENNELSSKLQAMQQALEKHSSAYEKAKQEVAGYKDSNVELQKKLAATQQQVDKLVTDKESIESKFSSDIEEFEDERKQLSAKLRDYHALNSERSELLEQLSKAEERFANAMGAKENAVRERDRIMTDIEVLAMKLQEGNDRELLESLLKKYEEEA